jgi:hypothetical protein
MHRFHQKNPLLYTILSHFHPQNALTVDHLNACSVLEVRFAGSFLTKYISTFLVPPLHVSKISLQYQY